MNPVGSSISEKNTECKRMLGLPLGADKSCCEYKTQLQPQNHVLSETKHLELILGLNPVRELRQRATNHIL